MRRFTRRVANIQLKNNKRSHDRTENTPSHTYPVACKKDYLIAVQWHITSYARPWSLCGRTWVHASIRRRRAAHVVLAHTRRSVAACAPRPAYARRSRSNCALARAHATPHFLQNACTMTGILSSASRMPACLSCSTQKSATWCSSQSMSGEASAQDPMTNPRTRL